MPRIFLAAAALATMAGAALSEPPAVPGPALAEGWSQLGAATISVDRLIGTEIRTYDQETIAAVQDVVLSPDGTIEGVVARFGGVLGFGETTVLLSMDEITVVEDPDERVFVLTDLTPELLEQRPIYEPER
jgi:hypothetical protein